MKINLVVIRSSNIEEAKDLYESILGLTFQEEKHGTGPKHFSAIINGTVLEIYPKLKYGTEGLRLGFSIANLDLAKEKLNEAQLKFKENPESIIFTDLDGHKIELKADQI